MDSVEEGSAVLNISLLISDVVLALAEELAGSLIVLLLCAELDPMDDTAAELDSVEEGSDVLETSLLNSRVVLAAALLDKELGKLLKLKSTVELIEIVDDTAGTNYQTLI